MSEFLLYSINDSDIDYCDLVIVFTSLNITEAKILGFGI